MPAFTPYLYGFLIAAGPAALAIALLWDDKRRLRGRLNRIFTAARKTDAAWSARPLTASDWTELFIEISPHEPV